MKILVNRSSALVGIMLFAVLVQLFLAQVSQATMRMPAFSLQEVVEGKKVTSEEFKGKTLLVTFFATWCPPCRQEIPSLIKLHEKYGAKNFSVLAFSIDQGGAKVVSRLVRQEKVNYPVLMSDQETVSGFGGIAGVPTSFLVNEKGNVVKSYVGYVSHGVLAHDIELILP
ncbi:MAG: TlpA family protein disulfide reductase [Desulfobulbaceae bacterium]|nr:TlpA family protein disulfide reductase [Desulfobulbaceae bacterium]